MKTCDRDSLPEYSLYTKDYNNEPDARQQCLVAIEHVVGTLTGHVGHSELWQLTQGTLRQLPKSVHEDVKDILAEVRQRRSKNSITLRQAKIEVEEASKPSNCEFSLRHVYQLVPKLGGTITATDKAAIEAVAGKPERALAYTFQYPERQAGAAVVLRGLKGSGKSTLSNFLRLIWGRHGLHISNSSHLTGNFNAHLADVCFLAIDEAFFFADSKHEPILKALITEPVLMLERKGLDAIQQPNCLKAMLTTNSDACVPASRDERRYCVFDVADTYIGNRNYFNELNTDTSSEMVQSAFLYAMLNRNISGWHTGDIPDSIGLRAQRYHSMGSIQKWLVDSLIEGTFTGGDWEQELSSANQNLAGY